MNKEIKQKEKNFKGYLLPTKPFPISLISIFAGIICILTMLVTVPVPSTGGYINIGDFGVMISAMIFGPIVGSISGGIGSALADLFTGYTIYAPATLIIKGLEGFIVGLISDPRKISDKEYFRDVLAPFIGGPIMVLGYFITEAFIFNLGIPSALAEIPGNLFQFLFGAIASIVTVLFLRKQIMKAFPDAIEKIFIVDLKSAK